MAGLNRCLKFAALVLPLLLLAMAGWARANVITVNTLDGGSDPAPLCTLEDAMRAASIALPFNGCSAGTGNDTIVFAVTGTISIQNTLSTTDPTLAIIGPVIGGVTISGSSQRRIFETGSTNLTLKNLTLANGADNLFFEGAAILDFDTNLDVENCTFIGNTVGTGGLGGAISQTGGTATILNSTFVNNTAGTAGAVFSAGGGTKITNSTFSGNTAASLFGTVVFAGNAAGKGSVIGLRGTILANSTVGAECGAAGGPFGSIVDDDFNVSDDASCGFTAMHSLSSTNPLLMPLASNGGPTQTLALEAGSPAISLDTDCIDQATPPNPVLTDQRLFIRPDSPTKCDSGAYEHDGVQAGIEEVPNTEHLQIARSSTPNSDQVNLSIGFIETAPCVGENALKDGIVVQLYKGTCADKTSGPLFLNLTPFVVHTIGQQTYGTLFQSSSPETVSARMVELPVPLCACGELSLNLEVSGLDTMALGLSGGNPFALVLTDGSGIHTGCFDITNAVVGSHLDPPRKVRRGVRR